MNRRLLFVLFVFTVFSTTSSDDCSQIFSTATSLGSVNGKCIAVTSNAFKGTSSQCKNIGNGVAYEQISIDSLAENQQVMDGLLNANVNFAYIGLWKTDSGWAWANNDPSTYSKWEDPPATPAPTVAAPTTTVRTTLPPSQQRRSTAVVVGVDASLFSTNALTFAQVEFVRSLSRYIADRGPAEFAFFAYGCTQITPYTSQYPTFVNSFEATAQMVANLNETINHDCVRVNPLDFKTMFRDQTMYYNRYSTSIRPFKSDYLSMIYFSSSTDSDNIKSTSCLYRMADSSVITVNVGDASIDVSPLSIPAWQNYFRVKTPEDILALVPKVDAIIFGTSGASEASGAAAEKKDAQFHDFAGEELAATATDCAYINATDGLWYSDGSCSTARAHLCQYFPPTPEPPPTPNPTVEWADPCYKETSSFTYFVSLHNAKCYRVSSEKKQFSEAENVCLSDHPLFLHSPKLTSIQSKSEEDMVKTLITDVENEGMFWFGLKRDPTNSSNWIFVNGDPFDVDFSHSNWRTGYPRDADGCDCVALVLNDNTWVNTDCNKNLYSVCAYRFNSTDKAF